MKSTKFNLCIQPKQQLVIDDVVYDCTEFSKEGCTLVEHMEDEEEEKTAKEQSSKEQSPSKRKETETAKKVTPKKKRKSSRSSSPPSSPTKIAKHAEGEGESTPVDKIRWVKSKSKTKPLPREQSDTLATFADVLKEGTINFVFAERALKEYVQLQKSELHLNARYVASNDMSPCLAMIFVRCIQCFCKIVNNDSKHTLHC